MYLKNKTPISRQRKLCSPGLKNNSWLPDDYETSIFDIYDYQGLFNKNIRNNIFNSLLLQKRLMKNNFLTVAELERYGPIFYTNFCGDRGIEEFTTYIGKVLFKR